RLLGRLSQAYFSPRSIPLATACLAGYIVYQHCPLSLMRVDGASMRPVLNPVSSPDCGGAPWRDFILVRPVLNYEELRIDQLIVFLSPRDPNCVQVKRLTALSHDFVETKNSDKFPSSSFDACSSGFGLGGGGGSRQVIVRPWHLWLEGTQKGSEDSRVYGPVHQALVLGRVVGVLRLPPSVRSVLTAGARPRLLTVEAAIEEAEDSTAAGGQQRKPSGARGTVAAMSGPKQGLLARDKD
ncbi:hypothetical protein BOX15_Mlig026949g1, partial [Macrostomum lignano]